MGITVSHTAFAPISLVSTIIGFVSFAFTLATFLRVFWENLVTIYGAPRQILDNLSSVKQGLLEERRHLRQVRRRIKNARRDTSHMRGSSHSDDNPGGGPNNSRGISTSRRRSWGGESKGTGGPGGGRRSRRRSRKDGPMHFDRDLQAMNSAGETAGLASMKLALRDMIKDFRQMEHPFLKTEFQNQSSAEWSTSAPYPYATEKNGQYLGSPYHGGDYDEEFPGAAHMEGSNRLGYEYRKCSFRERWLWLKRKGDVKDLSEALSRLQVRGISHEVGEILLMLSDVGRDLEDMRDSTLALEGRMSRVVGVRRVD